MSALRTTEFVVEAPAAGPHPGPWWGAHPLEIARGPSGDALRKTCLLPCMLLILSEGPADARALREQLMTLGFVCDVQGLGRRLMVMRRSGLLRVCAAPRGADQGRQWFRLARGGRHHLDRSAAAIREISLPLEAFFALASSRGLYPLSPLGSSGASPG
jgi:hypothetical protein